jgi:hypothetical protein
VGILDVCDAGLRALAGQCAVDASRLASQIPGAAAGPPAQATTVAASDVYAAIRTTATALAGRVQATGDKLTVSATQYASTDENSAQHLSALGASVQV